MKRRLLTPLIAIGSTATLLFGSGLIALVSDSVKSEGNTKQSGQYTPPSHDLLGAIDFNDGCLHPNTNYKEGPLAAVFKTGANMPLDGSIGAGSGRLCVKNAGSTTATVLMNFDESSVVETEVGACEASEASATQGSDSSCGNGAMGELGSVLRAQISVVNAQSTSSSCIGSGNAQPFANLYMPMVVDAHLAPGEICTFAFGLIAGSFNSDSERFAAQTDKIQFDILVTAQDALT